MGMLKARVSGAWVPVTASTVFPTATHRVSAIKATGQNIAHASEVAITYDNATEDYDTDSLHNPSSNSQRITIPAGMGGLWSFSGQVYGQAIASAGSVQGWLRVNGNSTNRYGWEAASVNASMDCAITIQDSIVLAAGDYVEVAVYQANAGSLARMFGATSPTTRFRANWVSP